jgi:hypothetical protein
MTEIKFRAAPGLLLGLALLAAPTFTDSAFAQQESEEIIEEILRMVGGLGGTGRVDPEALVKSELPMVSKLAGMEANEPIKVRLVSREEAVAHVAATLDAQLPPAKLARVEVVYKALGFLSPKQSLRDEITTLIGGQAGGFYDPQRKELVLLKDIPMMLQVPVVRHELVHALQDQNHDLSKWIAEAQDDEDQAAALQAVLEGHAVDVMNRATLAGLGAITSDMEWSPGMVAELMETLGMEGEDPEEAMEAAASLFDLGGADAGAALAGLLPRGVPPVLMAQLLFPYTTGSDFIVGYRKAHPEDPSCSGLYRRLPKTSAEILDPRRWESGTAVPDYPKSGSLLPGWRLLHETSLGRLMIWVLLTDQGDPSAGDPRGGRWGGDSRDTDVVLGAGWRGDRVALFASPDHRSGSYVPGSYAVVWASRWRDREEASKIAQELRSRRDHATIVLAGDRVLAIFAGPAVHRTAMLEALSSWR